MFRFLKIFTFFGIIIGLAHAGKIVGKAESEDPLGLSTQDSKIYGGRDTHIHEAPYQAYFRGCSGIIISPAFILTAAHCLPEHRFWHYKYQVRVGSANRTTGGQIIPTKRFIPHPQFRINEYEMNLSYDVGIVELESAIVLNENASVIELAKKEVPVGGTVMISGWGYTSRELDANRPKYLQSIQVPIIDRKICGDFTTNWGLGAPEITDKMICNYVPGKETCKGDSGSPVVFNKTLVGIVSWGHPGCGKGPGVNINVAHPEIRAFIKSNTNAGKIGDDAETKAQGNKIYGGRDTHIHEAPYQAYFDRCGGAIISPTLIVTAAHCLPRLDLDLDVRVGSANRTSGGQVIPSKRIIQHPKFRTGEFKINLSYDIGIIELKSPIELNENASIIQVAKEEVPVGERVMISGWGMNSSDVFAERPEYLQSIEVPIIDREECRNMTQQFGEEITDAMICSYEPGKDTCGGDSGGPLVFNKTLVGLVSWGDPDCGKGPGVNVNVAHPEIQAFIEENLKVPATKIPDGTKIVGGVNTNISEVPWTAALELKFQMLSIHFCGGIIISATRILTAAHCVENKTADEIIVRVGSSYLQNGGQVINVSSIVSHPEYNPEIGPNKSRFDYDVAVIKLNSSIQLNDNAKTVQLAKTEPSAGEEVKISGWGYKATTNQSSADILQSVKVPIHDRKECVRSQPTVMTDRMICTYLKGNNACRGDSGGPVVLNETLVGIVSGGSAICEDGQGLHVNVANDEIQCFIWKNMIL